MANSLREHLTRPDEARRLLRRVLGEIAEADWGGMPVTIAQQIQRVVRAEAGQADPYRAVKDRMNRAALDLLPALVAGFLMSFTLSIDDFDANVGFADLLDPL